MDQKHAMLYPPLEQGARNAMPPDQRMSASAAMGLPTEAPPSYDVAMAAGPSSASSASGAATAGWMPSAPAVTLDGATVAQPQPYAGAATNSNYNKNNNNSSSSATSAATARSVIVQQPRMQQPAPLPPTTWQQQQAQQQLQPQQQQPTQQQRILHLPAVPAMATTAASTASVPPKLGPNPCAVTCHACGTCRTTRMSHTPNGRTHLCALLLCLVGWCCCACCVPYMMNSCRTGNHYCSKCNTFLGTFNPRDK